MAGNVVVCIMRKVKEMVYEQGQNPYKVQGTRLQSQVWDGKTMVYIHTRGIRKIWSLGG